MTTALLRSRRLLGHLHETETNPSPLENGGGRLLHWHYNEFDDHNFQIHGQTLLYLFILFAVVLLATLLLLYARWYFRLRRPSSAPIPLSVSGPHHNNPCANTPKGLDFAVINGLPITLHVSSDVVDSKIHDVECCICLGAFEDGDKVKVLPGCSHRYHSNCVDTWLSGHSNCPLCRLPVRVDPNPV